MTVLQIAQAYNPIFNPDKCIFCATQVSFFGHLLSSQCPKPDPNKVKCTENFLQTTMVSELQSCPGLMNYMSRYDPELSITAQPLRGLTNTKTLGYGFNTTLTLLIWTNMKFASVPPFISLIHAKPHTWNLTLVWLASDAPYYKIQKRKEINKVST